jgi:hypothetical protein
MSIRPGLACGTWVSETAHAFGPWARATRHRADEILAAKLAHCADCVRRQADAEATLMRRSGPFRDLRIAGRSLGNDNRPLMSQLTARECLSFAATSSLAAISGSGMQLFDPARVNQNVAREF